jgi:NADH-quinone oxidoreductase subunit J
MHAALWLILSFFGVAGYYVLLDAGFFAAAQLLIYVGAISILFIFAAMLTRGNTMEPGNKLADPAAILSIVLFFVLVVMLAPVRFNVLGQTVGDPQWNIDPRAVNTGDNTVLTPAFWDNVLMQFGVALGDLNQYGILMLLAGALLLLSMLGSVYVARERKAAEIQVDRDTMLNEMKAEQALADAGQAPEDKLLPEPEHTEALPTHAHADVHAAPAHH